MAKNGEESHNASADDTPEASPALDAAMDIGAIMEEFSASYTAEVKSKITRLDRLIGESHWLSVGTYKESVIREQIVPYIPKRFTVSTGFVLAEIDGRKLLSRQIDLLVWDSAQYSPYFVDGDFVIVPPQALRAAIAVKGNLDHGQLMDGLSNLQTLSWFIHRVAIHSPSWFQTYLVAADMAEGLSFPDSIWNAIHKLYLKSAYAANSPINTTKGVVEKAWMTTEERRQWSRRWDIVWSLPWITGICVVGVGVMALRRLVIDNDHFAAYEVMHSAATALDDSFGLQRRLVLEGLGRGRDMERRFWYAPAKKVEKAEGESGQEQDMLILPFSEENADKVVQWNSAIHPFRPRKPWEWTLESAQEAFRKATERRKKAQQENEEDA